MNPDFLYLNGARPDIKDKKDFKWNEVAMGMSPFDWGAGYDVEKVLGRRIATKDQGVSGSCGGQSNSYYGEVLRDFFENDSTERSAKFLYSQVFVEGGGSRLRDLAKIATTQGFGRESDCPSYENGNPPSEVFMERVSDITDLARNNAKKDSALNYAFPAINIDELAQATEANHGCVIGITGSNNGTWLSDRPRAPRDGEKTWNHFLYVGKAYMDGGEKFLEVLNSWGEKCGNAGWQKISADYIGAKVNGSPCVWGAITYLANPVALPGVFSHKFNQTVWYGQKNQEIVFLQDALRIDGTFPKNVPSTGYYGRITKMAVLDFQKKYQVASPIELATLGGTIVGPKTRWKLNDFFGS